MSGRHRAPSGPAHRRPRRRPPAWALTAAGLVVAVGAGAGFLLAHAGRRAPSAPDAPAARPAVVTPATSAPTSSAPTTSSPPVPRTTPPATTPRPSASLRPVSVKGLGKRVDAAAQYAADHDVHAAVAVLDVRSGKYVGGGADRDLFGTASVMKVFIAARLLVEPSEYVSKDDLAEMISRSDDNAANAYWPRAGGTSLVDWVEDHYDVDDLGTPNTIPGRWGNTHVTARGLVHFYAAVTKDETVAPTLLGAMRDYSHYAADGTDQHFGLARADGDPEIKQGWAGYSADTVGDATVHTTGLVDGGRFAVAILTEGDHNAGRDDRHFLDATQRDVVDHMTRLLMPKGYIDPRDAP